MRIKIKQDKKELFSAHFSVYNENAKIGTMSFQGKISSPESLVNVMLQGKDITLQREARAQKRGNDPYRPYEIAFKGSRVGEVFQATKKTGLFKSFGYQYANINNIEYFMYPIGFGEQGSKNPIYYGDEQIALLKIDPIIIDDLHDYELIVQDESQIEVSIIFISYIYAKSFFKPGDKVKKGKVKAITSTTEKELLSKYNDSFESQFG